MENIRKYAIIKGKRQVGAADTITKEYMSDREVFADAFNYYLYDGEQVIKPESLKPLDTASISLPYGSDGKPVPVQKYRDLLKTATVMEDGSATYLLLGIEGQTQINYAMPVRNLLYDALSYSTQVADTAKRHKADGDAQTEAEFLSGFHREDMISPVITLTLYFGADSWDGSRSLHDMLSVRDEKVLKFVPDYRMNLIAPAEIGDEEFGKFRTELRQVFKCIKHSNDKRDLIETLESDESFNDINVKTAMLLNTLIGTRIRIDEKEGVMGKCLAIQQIEEDARNEGMEIGLEKGIEQGIKTLTERWRSMGMSEAEIRYLLGTEETVTVETVKS